ncbi:unnamed protein product [Cuscuta epithymum]|uniref:ZF-HD dimerization-type domain-containing protein n=1 Tax=Cuscuta epithymum TaxID=186058 RepID=A0AAV0FE72_9ASTE|nr:unnamed protein product [Cuscuta epithymum]
MEIPSSNGGEMAVPIHLPPPIHNAQVFIPAQIPSSIGPTMDQHGPHNINSNQMAVSIRYRECLKNHAAGMGGNATDGCGEFMPSGEDGSLESLICSACHCHRNFHRKEVEGDSHGPPFGTKVYLGCHHLRALYGDASGSSGPHQVINMISEPNKERRVVVVMRPPHPGQVVKKRFRTKFTQEQKEKMAKFAERVGWKIHKEEEAAVQQFCQQVGVKRRVLKVWMHNNKHTALSNKFSQHPSPIL